MPTTSERSDRIDWKLLGLYMADHVAGASAGIGRAKRMAKDFRGTPHAQQIRDIVTDLEAERRFYYRLLDRFDLPRRRPRQLAAAVVEKLGRLKLNRFVLRTSPMTPVLEAELLRAAILGKIGGWQTLREYADDLGELPERFDELIADAEKQIEQLSTLHETARGSAFLAGAQSVSES